MKTSTKTTIALVVVLMLVAAVTLLRKPSASQSQAGSDMSKTQVEGVLFSCEKEKLSKIETQFDAYLTELEILPEWFVKTKKESQLVYTLASPADETDTTTLFSNPKYKIKNDVVDIPVQPGKFKKLETVSKKEIVLSLLQHGRTTELSGKSCDFQVFKENVEIRQNIVMWSEDLNWVWPNGDPAFWNKDYWVKGTPPDHVKLTEAFNDMFFNQAKYSIGCYTASKMVFSQAILDYYNRVNPNPEKLKLIEERLRLDKDPLVQVDPPDMWKFEHDFDKAKLGKSGKLLKVVYGIGTSNFVPGDWNYIRNTDVKTQNDTGYEGSNAIYLGRGRFDDYYNDHHHFYTYHEKLNEVWQWRNGVYNRTRDKDKVVPLTEDDYKRIKLTPEKGGLVMDLRVYPYFFGTEELPPL